jgi:hypothetical protein
MLFRRKKIFVCCYQFKKEKFWFVQFIFSSSLVLQHPTSEKLEFFAFMEDNPDLIQYTLKKVLNFNTADKSTRLFVIITPYLYYF